MADTQSILQLGIEAARAGEKAEARELFRLVTREDPTNTQGWLWLAGVAEHRDEKRTALERVLELDPANDLARKGLNALGVAVPAAAAATPPDPAATAKLEPVETPPTRQTAPAGQPAPTDQTAPTRRARVYNEPEVVYAPASSDTAAPAAAALGVGAAAAAPAVADAARTARQEPRRTVPAEEEAEPRRGWGRLAFPLLLAALALLAFVVWQSYSSTPDTTGAGASPGAGASGQAVDAEGSSVAGAVPAGSEAAASAAPEASAAAPSEPATSAGALTSAAPSAAPETSAAPSAAPSPSADASAAAPSEPAPSPSAQGSAAASAAASEPAAGASAQASAAAPSEPAPSAVPEPSPSAAPEPTPEPTTEPPTTIPEPTPEPPTAVPPTPAPEPTAPGGDVASANPAIVANQSVVDAGDWSFSYGGISNFSNGPFGGAPPSRGRFEIVLITVRNNGSAPVQIPDGELVIKDGQGRVYDFNRAASVDYFDRFPDSGDLPADAEFPPNGLLSSVPLLFDVSTDASDLVLFSRDNLTQGFLIR